MTSQRRNKGSESLRIDRKKDGRKLKRPSEMCEATGNVVRFVPQECPREGKVLDCEFPARKNGCQLPKGMKPRPGKLRKPHSDMCSVPWKSTRKRTLENRENTFDIRTYQLEGLSLLI